jgi:hypothetical protein
MVGGVIAIMLGSWLGLRVFAIIADKKKLTFEDGFWWMMLSPIVGISLFVGLFRLFGVL